jgi:heat shock protein HslJ/membrane-bound inhibitor of C-type lysozyme
LPRVFANRRACFGLIGLAAAATLAGSAFGRDLTGALAYRERIALPPDAVLLVEATDSTGLLLASLRQPTAGAQVPLAFTLAVPDGQDVTLRGGLTIGGETIGGETRWLSAPVQVAADAAAGDLGAIALAPYRAVGATRPFRCGDLGVAAGFHADAAILRVGPRLLTLAAVETASGAKYADPADSETWAWSKGEALTISLGGTTLPDCTPALPATEAWRAGGHEPDWAVEVRAGQASLTFPGTAAVEWALPAPEAAGTGTLYRLGTDGPVLTVFPELCRDSMTGMPHPDRVTLAEGGRDLAGCGGDPVTLLAGPEWHIAEIAGAPLPENAEATLRFSPGGGLFGKAACNRFMGRHTLSGEGLRLETGGMTMMACPDPLMAAERAILDALARVDRFDVDEAGELRLLGGDAVLLRARF